MVWYESPVARNLQKIIVYRIFICPNRMYLILVKCNGRLPCIIKAIAHEAGRPLYTVTKIRTRVTMWNNSNSLCSGWHGEQSQLVLCFKNFATVNVLFSGDYTFEFVYHKLLIFDQICWSYLKMYLGSDFLRLSVYYTSYNSTKYSNTQKIITK